MFHLYGFLIAIGVLSGLFIAKYQARRFRIPSDVLDDAFVWIVIAALIGARIYHLVTDWDLYATTSILELFSLWNGGLGLFGALIGGVVGILLFVHREKNSKKYISKQQHQNILMRSSNTMIFFTLLDLFSFGAPLAQAVGRLGNFFNQELYGLETTLPWAISVGGKLYHPLFLYEAVLNMCVFLVLNFLGWKKKLVLGKGQYACVYLGLYGVIRFWLEFLRVETARFSGFFGFFSVAQWVSIAFMLMALFLFWLRRHADRGVEWELRKFL